MFLGGYPLAADINNAAALTGMFEARIKNSLKPYNIGVNNIYRSLFIREKLSFSGTSTSKLRKAIANEINYEKYEDLLFQEIQELKPNIIVPIDDIALCALVPRILKLSKPRNRSHWVYCFRGSIMPLREDWQQQLPYTVRVIPTISPQLMIADAAAQAYSSLDYSRIVKSKNLTIPITNYGMRWVAKTAGALYNFLNRSYAANPEFMTFDIETYGGLITCISFCFDGIEGVSVPILDNSLSVSERAAMVSLVDRVLRSAIPKVNQNIKYDWIILERFGFFVNNVIGDTMLAGSCIYPELPKGLDFYTSIYTEIPYYKDEGKNFDPKTQERDTLYMYNALDSIATHCVWTAQQKELEDEPRLKAFHTELSTLLPVYKRMDETGIRIDFERRAALIHKYTLLFESNLIALRGLVNIKDFNPGSPDQVGKILYEDLKFPRRVKKTESGKLNYVTDKGTLDDFCINYADIIGPLGKAVVSRVIVCRKLLKVLEYLNTPISVDGRFRSTSNLAGTESGRSSYSKSLDEIFQFSYGKDNTPEVKLVRVGRSLQTITKHGFKIDEDVFEDFEDKSIAHDLRSMFVPSAGYVFLEADGSQAEARHVAVLAQDWELLDSFDKKPKIHAKTAAMIFNVPAESIGKDYPSVPGIGIAYYDLGKRIRHAGNYGVGAFMLAIMTHISAKLCEDMLTKFHAANPQIREIFHEEVARQLQKHKQLETPLGRRRIFYSQFSNKKLKEGISYIPQSTVSDHTKLSIPRILNRAPEIRFLAEMHDGLLMEVRPEKKEEYALLVKEVLERPVNYSSCSLSRDVQLIVPAEISIGENWMDLQELKL